MIVEVLCDGIVYRHTVPAALMTAYDDDPAKVLTTVITGIEEGQAMLAEWLEPESARLATGYVIFGKDKIDLARLRVAPCASS